MKKNLLIKIDDDEEQKYGSQSPMKTRSNQAIPKKEVQEIKTVVKQENDNEVFITDAPDIDFDQLNEQQMQYIEAQIISENQVIISAINCYQGQETDIVTDEVNAQSAYFFFKKQEEEVYEFQPS